MYERIMIIFRFYLFIQLLASALFRFGRRHAVHAEDHCARCFTGRAQGRSVETTVRSGRGVLVGAASAGGRRRIGTRRRPEDPIRTQRLEHRSDAGLPKSTRP